MENELLSFIRSLRNDRYLDRELIIPAGVVNKSALLEGLKKISRNGRILNSDLEYDHARAVAHILTCLCSENPSNEQLEQAVICMAVLLGRVFDVVTEISQDTCTEEILMMAIGPDALAELSQDFQTLPYVLDEAGNIQPNFASLQLFAQRRPITTKIKRAFTERHYVETLPFLFEDETEIEGQPDSRNKKGAIRQFQLKGDDIDNTTVDKLEGFDEFYDYFWDHHYKWYSEGADLEDLPNIPDDEIDGE